MSAAARAFAAQQERRRRRLLVGPLLLEASLQEERAERAGQRHDPQASEPEQQGVQHDANNKAATPPAVSRNMLCASQQRALATLRRRHPTATLLAGLPSTQGPGTKRDVTKTLTGGYRWRRALPWAVTPPVAPQPSCAPTTHSSSSGAAAMATAQHSASAGAVTPAQHPASQAQPQAHARAATAAAAPAHASAPPLAAAVAQAPHDVQAHRDACVRDLLEALHAVQSALPRLYGPGPERTAQELRDQLMGQRIAEALDEEDYVVEEMLRSRDGHASGTAGVGSGAADIDLEAHGLAFAQRMKRVGTADLRRMQERLVCRGWRNIEEAWVGFRGMWFKQLVALMQQLQPGPGPLLQAGMAQAGADGADGAAALQAVKAAVRGVEPWFRLAKMAAAAQSAAVVELTRAAAAGRDGGESGIRGGEAAPGTGSDDSLVLRLAVLGLVLLEGSDVGQLGPLEPLACALLAPLLRLLHVEVMLQGREDPWHYHKRLYLAPSMLYDVLARVPPPAAEEQQQGAAPCPPAARFSMQHFDFLYTLMVQRPELLLAHAELALAFEARAAAAEIAARALDAVATYRTAPGHGGGQGAGGGPQAAERSEAASAPGRVTPGCGALQAPTGASSGTAAASSGGGSGRTAAAQEDESESSFASVLEGHEQEVADSADGDDAFEDAENGVAGASDGDSLSGGEESGSGGPVEMEFRLHQPPLFNLFFSPQWLQGGSDGEVDAAPRPPQHPFVARGNAALAVLADLGLLDLDLDLEHDSTAVQRLRCVFRRAERARAATMAWAQHKTREEFGDECQRMFTEAENRCEERRRRHALARARWAQRLRCSENVWELVLRGVLRAEIARGLADVLRPKLLAAHPGTWGALMARAAEAEAEARGGRGIEDGRRVKELLRHAMIGLAVLAGQELPLHCVRLAYCVATGVYFLSYEDPTMRDYAIGVATDLFLFLAHVPKSPNPGSETSGGLGRAAAGAAQPRAADPWVVQQSMRSVMRDAIERYYALTDITATLAECMALQEQQEEQAAAAADGGPAAGAGPSEPEHGARDALWRLAYDIWVLFESAQAVPSESDVEDEEERPLPCDVVDVMVEVRVQGSTRLGGAAAAASAAVASTAPGGNASRVDGSAAGAPPTGISQLQARSAASTAPASSSSMPSRGGASAADGGASGGGGHGSGAGPRGAATAAGVHGYLPQIDMRTSPQDVMLALRHLISCCSWLDGADDGPAPNASVPPPPPTAHTSLVAVGPDHMLTAMLLLYEVGTGPMRKAYWSMAFEPVAGERLAQSALRLEAHQQVRLFPPPRGEPGVVVLGGAQMAPLPHFRQAEYVKRFHWDAIRAASGLIVSAASRWSDQFKLVEKALVKQRLGALWIWGEGAEGVQRALLMAAKVCDELRAQHNTTLYVGVTEVVWTRKDEDPAHAGRRGRRVSDGGGGGADGDGKPPPVGDEARKACLLLYKWVVHLQLLTEQGEPMRANEWQSAMAALQQLRRQLQLPEDAPLRECIRVELRLMECERGRPDRPRLPLGGKAVEKQRLKELMLKC